MSQKEMCYERDFLSRVILRADFTGSPISLPNEPSEFTRKVADRFPVATSTPVRDVMFNVTDVGGAIVNNHDRGHQWSHRKSVDGTIVVILEADFISLEYGPADYKGYAQIAEDFAYIADALGESFGIPEFSRVGLRYINEIRLPGRALDWDGVIAPGLISTTLHRVVADGRLQRSMHQLCELHGDDQVLLTHGLFNPDFPAPLVQKHYIIDIDCSRNGQISAGDSKAVVKRLNSLAASTFEGCIDEKLRKEMGVKGE
jgi:uncharacterized protein (TIGR04255 family)